MRINFFIKLLVTISLIESCSTGIKLKKVAKLPDDAIHLAISDFLKIRKLNKKDSVFYIEVRTSSNDNNLIVVDIGKNNFKYPVSPTDLKYNTLKLPTQYLIQNKKLFFWRNKDSSLPKDALDVYTKYNIIIDDKYGKGIPDIVFDDLQKYAVYYFCKNNLARYKRIITNKGNYKPPKVACYEKVK